MLNPDDSYICNFMSRKTMVRRKRKRLCKMILTFCVAVFCLGMLLRAVVTSLELRTLVVVDEESNNKDISLSKVQGVSVFRQKKVRNTYK